MPFLITSCTSLMSVKNFRNPGSTIEFKCSDIPSEFDTVSLPKNINEDPMIQLNLWEQLSNVSRYHKDIQAQEIDWVNVDPDDIIVRDLGASDDLKKLIYNEDDSIRWYHHPYNSSTKVPYLKSQSDGHILGDFSASRSMFINASNERYSIKMPTSNPHKNMPSYGKDNLKNDSILSIQRSRLVRGVDKLLGKHPKFDVLTEVISVFSKSGENAFSIRDLRPLQNGHYYMPAFSIPFAGREIAKHLGEEFVEIFRKNYAFSLGQAKALLLLRYGLQMKTPNPQNFLIEFDVELRPTGKIIFRDLADSSHVDFIANNIGLADEVAKDREQGFGVIRYIHPKFDVSVGLFEEAGMYREELKLWERAHEEAYIETFRSELGIEESFFDFSELQTFLKSENGQKLLKSYGLIR